jgi:hypothetical protein
VCRMTVELEDKAGVAPDAVHHQAFDEGIYLG